MNKLDFQSQLWPSVSKLEWMSILESKKANKGLSFDSRVAMRDKIADKKVSFSQIVLKIAIRSMVRLMLVSSIIEHDRWQRVLRNFFRSMLDELCKFWFKILLKLFDWRLFKSRR
ncbi:hypothetical protein BpHYR1_002567 [Brachionus plicatilis]|uniref:Uncharacterized protein n=1 Tax=Brachionus plicatilis TaxID=10195 RepID=A0A3M7RH72_BRAPC|nr:hypothetical protein BpHYR1_002567 [Brachionus plicatilis]